MKNIKRRINLNWVHGFAIGWSWDKYDQSITIGLGVFAITIKIWM